MSDELARLQQELRTFAKERDWEQYHTPRNLAALISSEAGELLALFRWDQNSLVERRGRFAKSSPTCSWEFFEWPTLQKST